MNEKKRGSVLAAAIILSACVGMVAASSAQRAHTERRLNYESTLLIEAQNAAEAVAEHGVAQLVRRFESRSAFPMNELRSSSGGNPLTLQPSFYNLFNGGNGLAQSNVSIPTPYDPKTAWGQYPTEIIGGVIPPMSWKFIDGRDPANTYDPLRGQRVLTRGVVVYGKATVVSVYGRQVTAYCAEELQVRDAPLFANAIFYNMDMEIAPSPPMIISGTVHSNGNMFVMSSNSLNFLAQVTSVGSLFHGGSNRLNRGEAGGGVSFVNASGESTSMWQSGWLDSTNRNWHSLASTTWNGNVQDAAFGVQVSNPAGIQPYVADDPDTNVRDDALNYGYSLITPLDTTGTADRAVEKQKFAYNAGLIVTVQTDSRGRITGYSLKTPVRDINGNIVYSGNTPQMVDLTPNASVSNAFVVQNYSASNANGSTVVNSGLFDARRHRGVNLMTIDMGVLRNTIHANNSSDWGREPANWWNGIVYVQFPQSSDPVGKDGIQHAVDNSGVRLVNGQSDSRQPGIPDPAGVGAFTAPRGTTIATNNALYVQGNYNADGNARTGSPTQPDSENEPPAALVADSITILSEDWNDANSARGVTSRMARTITEVSAALLTGIVPSDKGDNNAYSGGVENFPRFLERWTGTSFTYRGSMVSLFESEIGRQQWGTSGVYDPPNRDWGFNQLFSQGLYPPGTPNTRSYRRINFRFLTPTEWQNELASLASSLTSN